MRLWIIFKDKLHQKSWHSLYPDAHIAISDNEWTDHEIGLEWLKMCFELETQCGDEYKLLILDGHGSHTFPDPLSLSTRFSVTNLPTSGNVDFVACMERQLEPSAGHRFFVVTLITYGSKSAEGTLFEKFSVVCAVPDSDRFRNLPIPRPGRYVKS